MKLMNFQVWATAATVAVVGFSLIQIASAGETANKAVAPKTAAPMAAYTNGEIKNVDAARGTVTLKHGPIDNLGMPDMTMVFRVSEPVQLASFKVGDKVRFRANRVKGVLLITELTAQY